MQSPWRAAKRSATMPPLAASSSLLASLLQVGDSAMLKTRLRVASDDVEPVDEEVVEVDEASTPGVVAASVGPPPDSEGTCLRFNFVMVRFFSGVSDHASAAGDAFLGPLPPLTDATAPLPTFRSPAKTRTMRFLHRANLCRSLLLAPAPELPASPI